MRAWYAYSYHFLAAIQKHLCVEDFVKRSFWKPFNLLSSCILDMLVLHIHPAEIITPPTQSEKRDEAIGSYLSVCHQFMMEEQLI